MRIIKEGKPKAIKNTTPISIVCQNCGLEAELERGEDVAKCPCCGSFNLVLTIPFVDFCRKKSPSEGFPEEYDRFTSRDNGGSKPVSNAETAEMIERTVAQYKSEGGGYAFSDTGDTFVAVFQTNQDDIDNFLVVVSKDHYEWESEGGR